MSGFRAGYEARERNQRVGHEPTTHVFHVRQPQVRDELTVPYELPHEPEHVVGCRDFHAGREQKITWDYPDEIQERPRIRQDRRRMPERILEKAGDAAIRQTGSPMRSRDGDD